MASRLTPRRTQFEGALATVRQGHLAGRALAVADSRSFVRCLFLASALQSDLLAYLRTERALDEIGQHLACQRTDRLAAWLGVGSDLGELRRRGDRYRVAGRRARALAGGDELLSAHYRSMLEYQVGPYAEIDRLLADSPGDGRGDLADYAEEIAAVSLAAAPFVSAMVRRAVSELRPERVLDVGCGSGIYTSVVLSSDPRAQVEGIDLAEDVVLEARRRLASDGVAARARLHVGDVRDWLRGADRASPESTFDLVMLLNNIYYFDRRQRADLYRELGSCLRDGGELLVVSMTAPGSVAAAHLHFMLTCQRGTASLPGRDELSKDLARAGFELIENEVLVPTEPFVGIRARRVGRA
jgi:SAM-dependent methyltransferase